MIKKSQVYDSFKSDNWKNLSQEDRLFAFQLLQDIDAKKSNRESYKVVRLQPYFTGRWDGKCCYEEREIRLDKKFLEQDDLRFEGMATLFHECRHSFQFSAVQKSTKASSKQIKEWKDNYDGYINSTKKLYTLYTMQPIELDARSYTITQMEDLTHIFKKDPLFLKKLKELKENEINYKNEAIRTIGDDYQTMVKYEIRRNIYLESINKD